MHIGQILNFKSENYILFFYLETKEPKVQGLETPAKNDNLILKSPKLARYFNLLPITNFSTLKQWGFLYELNCYFLHASVSEADFRVYLLSLDKMRELRPDLNGALFVTRYEEQKSGNGGRKCAPK
jgi:hypothetical protein